MPLQRLISSDPCSLAQSAVCLQSTIKKRSFQTLSSKLFPSVLETCKQSSLGASNIFKHNFKPVIIAVWSLTAPKAHIQNDNHCTSACMSYYSQVPSEKILPVCQENRSRLCFLWKSGSESSGAAMQKTEWVFKCVFAVVQVSVSSHRHILTWPNHPGFPQGRAINSSESGFNINFEVFKTHDGKVIKTSHGNLL